jgi:hypothetical protein
MEDLPVPEDHSPPHTPIDAFAKGKLEACNPDRAVGAQCLRRRQLMRLFGEEEIVLAAAYTSPFA